MKNSKQLTVIKDPNLEPYFITKDDHCYTVQMTVKPNANHFRTKGKGNEYVKPQTYWPNLSGALNWIAHELLHTKSQHESLTEVIEEFKSIEKRIKSFTNEFRSTI